MEELLGMNLLTPREKDAAEYPTISTKDAFNDKEFVLLYFSAVCPSCEFFCPLLKEFYEKHGDAAKIQVVYVSSDKTLDDFDENYAKMPWPSITNDDDGYEVKKRLAERLKVQKLPVLIILQVETGLFISNKAHLKIRVMDDRNFSKSSVQKVLEEWKNTKAVPIEEGVQDEQIHSLVMGLLKNPAWIFILYYAYKWFFKDMLKGSTNIQSGEDEL